MRWEVPGWVAVLVLWSACVGAQDPVYDGTVRCVSGAYLIPPYPSSHASFIEALPGTNKSCTGVCGNLIIAYFSGQGEGENGIGIVTTILQQGTFQWPKAIMRSQRFGYSNQNPVLHYNASGELYLPSILPYFLFQATGTVETNSTIWSLFSNTEGENFTEPQILFPGFGSYDRNRITLNLDQDWLYPLYNESVGGSVLGTKNNLAPVLPQANWLLNFFPDSDGLVQPTLIRPVPGKPFLRAYFRDRAAQHIYTATSADDGATWTTPSITPLPNNNAAIQATVLQSGKVAIVYNPLTSGRYILSISLSSDQGQTWNITKVLLESSDYEDEFSYPSILQTQDGMIHVTFTYLRETIKYMVFSEDWIEQ